MNKRILRKTGFISVFLIMLLVVYINFYKNISRLNQNLNVILITIETLLPSHLSLYGYNKKTSPEIDKFAQESIIFLNAISTAPSTCPSIAAIMTSKYPSFHGMIKNSQSYFPQENTTLAEILKKHEYQTAAFVGNFILRKEKGLNKGFQVYDDTYPQEEKVRHLPERIASSLSDAAINWISQHYKKKFFLWLHYQDPHGPYTPPYPYNKKFSINLYTGNTKIKLLNKDDDSGWGGIPWYQQIEGKQDARFYISQYDGEILYLDHHIGRLINVIKKLKLDKKTLIIITADHGEALDNAHGYYFSHENGLTDDQIKVPLIIKFPGCEKIQKIIKDPVSTINIMPTILDIIGVSTPSNLQGKNLFKSRRNYVFGENHLGTQNFSIRMDHFKLIYRDKKKNFYDLLKDPIESKNIYNPQNKNCEKMENILIEYIEKTKQIKTKAKTLTPTQEDIRRLKSLGYL